MKGAVPAIDAPEDDAIGGHVDRAGGARWAKGAGIKNDYAGRGSRHAAAVGMSHREVAGGEVVLLNEGGGAVRRLAPRAEHAKDAAGRPHGVLEEPDQVAEAMWFGLVALRDGVGGAAESGEAGVEVLAFGRWESSEFVCDEFPGERGIATPRNEIVEEGVAVGDEKSVVGERAVVDVGDVGVVVTREKRGGWGGVGEEVENVGEQRGSDGGRRGGARIEGVAVEEEFGDAVEKRGELRERG